jgi:chromate transporter
VAIAQSLPGPASSQVGFALGLLRAGWMGGVAAWLGFTLPSALLMLAFGLGHRFLLSGRLGLEIMHGLQLVAVAVVAQAILAMRKSLAPDAFRLGIALLAVTIVFFNLGTLLAIATGALLGLLVMRSPRQQHGHHELQFGLSKRVSVVSATLFLALLFLVPIAASLTSFQSIAVFSAFYRTGALVFGGGHVVLPLLEKAVVARGWVDQQSFLAGYGAAQALPGPLFTFAAYLGEAIRPTVNPIAFSVLALVAIFLPGLLLIVAVLPYWSSLRARPWIQSILLGVNAAVVGVLMAAFIRPVWTSAVRSPFDLATAIVAFALLVRWKVSPWIIVIAVASVSALASVLSVAAP